MQWLPLLPINCDGVKLALLLSYDFIIASLVVKVGETRWSVCHEKDGGLSFKNPGLENKIFAQSDRICQVQKEN